MDDLIPTLVSALIGLLLLFFIPICFTAGITESTVDTYVTHKADVFGDQVCKNGYLTQEMYEDFIHDLSNTELLYDITFTRSHTTQFPVYDAAGNFTGEVKTVIENTYTDDIMQELSTRGIFELRMGDTFSIAVRSRSLTTAQKLYSFFGIKADGIAAFGGGLVVDENH